MRVGGCSFLIAVCLVIVLPTSLLHNLLLLSRIALLYHLLEDLEWEPGDEREEDNFEDERAINVASLEVLLEDGNTAKVNEQSDDNGHNHLDLNLRHLAEHVEHLDQDQCTERDADNVDERLIELGHRDEHDKA